MNRKDAKYHGGENNDIGIEYEIRFAIKELVEMILPTNSVVKTVKLKRQTNEYVDDIFVEQSNKVKVFYQCKHFKTWIRKTTNNERENKLWLDFLSQHRENLSSKLVLVTQNKDPGYDKLANLAKKYNDFKVFKQELENDSYLKKAFIAFSYFTSLIKEENSEYFVFSFLKKFRIVSSDDYLIRVDSLKSLEKVYSEADAKNIFNLFHSKLNGDWLGKDITKDILVSELEKIEIDVDRLKQQSDKYLENISFSQSPSVHTLENSATTFSKKLDYLLGLINNGKNSSSKEFSQEISKIESDNNLAWHFFRNLKDPTWFPMLKDNIIKTVSGDPSDSSAKYQLLEYFEKCAETHSDEIIFFLLTLEKNTQDFNILSRLVKTTSSLKPKSPESLTSLWQIFDDLVEHQHPWVRREIPKALLSFIDIDDDKVLSLLRRLFTYSPPPQDVTQGSPTLTLTFQGRDNENSVFEETIQNLSKLLSDPKHAEKAHSLARKMEISALSKDERSLKLEQGIILDNSSIWLSDMSFDSSRLEYNYDCKERIALEIEKSLNELVLGNKDLVLNLLNKLLLEKYEVFYLIVIKVLIRHLEKFRELSKSLVFDSNVWNVYNVRNYFLQTLANTYFKKANKKEIAEFVKMINQQSLKDDRETLYLNQSMLISIPEEYRTQQINDKLTKISEVIKTDPKISKPFMVTTWSGIRPDITVEELNTKSEDDLVQIMLDSSNGKRAASYDIAPVFSQLIDQKSDLLPSLLARMKGKKIAPDFAGEMTKAYRKKKPEDVAAIADLITFLGENDTWARIEIARYFKEICRKKEIQNYTQGVIEKIRDTLITLTHDKNPESDDTYKSSNPRPNDAITRGINSVRGITTEALIAFCYYFPTDEIASQSLKELTDDNTKAIKATLIYYLPDLIGKNFALCEGIVNKFRNRRDPEIDFALIHFFSQLNCDKFLKYQDFIKLLFNNTHEQISEDLGKLIGYRYINGCDVQTLLDEVISNRKGTKHTRRSLAFVFESRMGGLIGQPRDRVIANYLKKLMSPKNDFEVVERASFVFQRDEIKPEHFGFMDENGLTTELVLNKLNIPAQKHLVDYLHKCIEANISVERCVELLHEQVTTIGAILSDQLIEKKIAEIVAKLIKRNLSTKTQELLQDIFNAGLERGWEEFYAIYFDLRDHKPD